MTQDEIKKHNRKIKAMNKRNQAKLAKIRVDAVVITQEEREQNMIEEGVCPDCHRDLPDPIAEDRGQGYSELMTYCQCGVEFTSGI